MKNFPSKQEVERLRAEYPPGTRIRLVSEMKNDWNPVPVGTLGTVNGVDGIGSLLVHWDNGSSLHALYGVDEVEKVEEIGGDSDGE